MCHLKGAELDKVAEVVGEKQVEILRLARLSGSLYKRIPKSVVLVTFKTSAFSLTSKNMLKVVLDSMVLWYLCNELYEKVDDEAGEWIPSPSCVGKNHLNSPSPQISSM